MTAPDFCFVDNQGNRLPFEDGVQHIRQYGGYWRVRIEDDWQGRVAIRHTPPIFLERVNINDWKLPDSGGTELFKGAVGTFSVVLLDVAGNSVAGAERILRIEPANISWDELDSMLEDIGVLALQYASCVEADVKTPILEGIGPDGVGVSIIEGRGALQTASRLLALFETLKVHWPAIQKRPLKTITSKLGIVRLDKYQTGPMMMVKQKMEPHRISMAGLAINEDMICPENAFLSYVLDRYLITGSSGAILLLQSAEQEVEEKIVGGDIPLTGTSGSKLRLVTANAKAKQASLRPQYKQRKEHIIQIINALKAAEKWASDVRSSAFFKDIRTPTYLPTASLRLSHSPHYGPVYTKFIACQAHTASDLECGLFLFEQIKKHRIRAAWNIYELWCVITLYTAFAKTLNLKPPKGENSLFDSAKLENGEFRLPNNTPFRLEGQSGDRKTNLTLWYEKNYYDENGVVNAKPDIVIEIKINGETSQTYCFDAKYRNYTKQGVNVFIEDVYKTAYKKYQEKHSFKTGFILHTDSIIDYWGEVGIRQFIKENIAYFGEHEPHDVDEWAHHRYGAVRLKPGVSTNRQFQKLMQLVLQFHGRFWDTCFNCGYHLRDNDIQHNWRDLSKYNGAITHEKIIDDARKATPRWNNDKLYCLCPQCGSFWVIQHCARVGKHRLIKTNESVCIHRPSERLEHAGKWVYKCPSCGDDPSYEDEEKAFRHAGNYENTPSFKRAEVY